MTDKTPVLTPRFVNRLEGTKITQIAIGKYHSIAISGTGDVYSWGHHGEWRLGLPSKNPEPFPMKIPGIEGVTGGGKLIEKIGEASDNVKLMGKGQQINMWHVYQAANGAQHTVALTKGGNVWVWGEGRNGALGLGETVNYDVMNPTLMIKNSLTRVVSVSAGAFHSIAITASGEVYTWGNGEAGQLGTGSTGLEFNPRVVESLQGRKIIQAYLEFFSFQSLWREFFCCLD